MSQKPLEEFIDRAHGDGDLWVHFEEWPDEVVTQYYLSDDEVEALRAGNLILLRDLGVGPEQLRKARDLIV